MTYDKLLEYKKQFPNTSEDTLKALYGLTNNCKDNQCARCGQCCTELIPLTQVEVKRIRNYLKENPDIKPTEWFNYNEKLDKFTIAVLCPFLNKEMNSCSIYEVRPQICKTFKCSNKLENIIKNKETIHKKSYYNSYNLEKDNLKRRTYSTYELFFGDKSHTVAYIIAESLRATDYSSFNKKSDIYKYIKSVFNYLGREDIASDNKLMSLAYKILDNFLEEMNINEKQI